MRHGHQWPSDDYCGLEAAAAPFAGALGDPPADAVQVAFDAAPSIPALRRLASSHAGRVGLGPGRGGDLALAVTEIATNSLRHGGGRGLLQIWRDGPNLLCEVRDA